MNVKNYVRALLCLALTYLLSFTPIHGQALRVGDAIPDELWDIPLQVVNHPSGKHTITLAEYKDKLIILDFWATWCGPCVAMLPRQDSLQKMFAENLQILPVTYQNEGEITDFMDRYTQRTGQKITLPKVTNDSTLRRAFPHSYLPHYVWIQNGAVKAITGHEEVTSKKIRSVLKDGLTTLSTKADPKRIAFDKESPLLVNGNGGSGDNLIYHSLFTGYQKGLPSAYFLSQPDSIKGVKLTCTNLSRLSLFKNAFGERTWPISANQIMMEVKEPGRLTSALKGSPYLEWLEQGNGFCYELILPASRADQVFSIMRRDLDLLFPDYTAAVEKHLRNCYVLTRSGTGLPLVTRGGEPAVIHEQFRYKSINRPLGLLVRNLNMKFLQHSPYPILNETGFEGPVDIDIEANMSEIDDLNRALAKYGLKFMEEEREIDMLVIRDRKNP